MPVFNGEKFIKDAIKSVAIQNVPVKLIVVNDCSTDKSVEIVKQCKNEFDNPKITLVDLHQNKGVAYCRNLAIKMADTKYVAFLDCDDIWLSGKLAQQLEILKKNDANICCTARELIDFNGKTTGKIIAPEKCITYNSMLIHNSIAMSSAIIKTEIAKKFTMQSGNFHEDYIFWLDVLKQHTNAIGLSEVYTNYRLNQNSKSGNKIKSAKMHYNSLLKHGVNPIKAIFLFVVYAFFGVINHKL